MKWTHLSSWLFSASLARAKLSRLAHTLTSLLLEKKPPSAIPASRKPLVLSRPLGFGFRSFLKDGNTEAGIAPFDDGAGGGWGGSAVGGGGCDGLNTACNNKPSA